MRGVVNKWEWHLDPDVCNVGSYRGYVRMPCIFCIRAKTGWEGDGKMGKEGGSDETEREG